ncbi:hypothetical protein GGX14DRAFT_611433, partial [Mycena pura]
MSRILFDLFEQTGWWRADGDGRVRRAQRAAATDGEALLRAGSEGRADGENMSLSNGQERGWRPAKIGCSGAKKRWRPSGGGETGKGQRAAGSERRAACGVFVVGGAWAAGSGRRVACAVKGQAARRALGVAGGVPLLSRMCCKRSEGVDWVLAVISAYIAGSTDARGAGNDYTPRGGGMRRPRRALGSGWAVRLDMPAGDQWVPTC